MGKNGIWIIGIVLTVGLLSMHVHAETVAEQLGYPPNAKLLILHGDDIGMCHSANQAAIKAFQAGMVKTGSVMVPCPWFMEIAQYAQNNPDADLGLHLTLTAEWKSYRWRPLADLSLVKGLLDGEGYMHHGVRAVYENSNAREAEAEVRAQIDFAIQHGMKPTHLDSHMGTLYYNPQFLEVALRLSEEYDIPFMFFKANQEFLSKLPSGNREMFTPLSAQMEKRGIPLLDAMPSIEKTPVDKMEEAYRDLIRNIKPGLSLVILHLADESKEYDAITNSYERRLAEFKIFTNPDMKKLIQEQDIHLIGWKDLNPLWKKRLR